MFGFFLVMLAVVFGSHAYIGFRLVQPASIGATAKTWLWIVLALSAISIPATFVGGRMIESELIRRILSWVGFTALGTMGIFAALVLLRDVFLAGSFVPIRDPSRRDFLRSASSVAVLGAGSFLFVRGIVQAARPPALEYVRVPIDGLPKALQGFRIAQISDLHLGPTLGRPFLEDVVRRVNELEPDLIAVTGDLADGYVDQMRHMVEPVKDLKAKNGVYFTTGNHEYYWNVEEWVDHLRRLGLTVLVNEHEQRRIGDAVVAVGGVTDLREGKRAAGHAHDPEKAFAGADDVDFKLLLAHQPGSLYGAKRAGVHLQLSGHTHGGQVFPMSILVHLAHPIVAGLGRFDDTWVYVNRGTAYWGPPMRTAGTGEITLVELA